jgi:hypothetical protein
MLVKLLLENTAVVGSCKGLHMWAVLAAHLHFSGPPALDNQYFSTPAEAHNDIYVSYTLNWSLIIGTRHKARVLAVYYDVCCRIIPRYICMGRYVFGVSRTFYLLGPDNRITLRPVT